MKRKDIKSLHQKSVKELEKMVQELTISLAKFRLQKAANKLEKPSLIKSVSDDIARCKTIITEKKLVEDSSKEEKQEAKKQKVK